MEFSNDSMKEVQRIIAFYPEGKQKSAVIPVLHLAQKEFGGWLSSETMDYVASILKLEPIEVYEGKAIFYSLGNFIFDQGLSFWTEHGLAVNVELSSTTVTYTQIPTVLYTTEANVATSTEEIAKVLGVTGMPSQFTLPRVPEPKEEGNSPSPKAVPAQ